MPRNDAIDPARYPPRPSDPAHVRVWTPDGGVNADLPGAADAGHVVARVAGFVPVVPDGPGAYIVTVDGHPGRYTVPSVSCTPDPAR